MYDILAYGFGVTLISSGVFVLAIAACVVVDRHQARTRVQERFERYVQRHARLCWMCERRPALPDRAECKRCRKVYEAATQERIAA